MDRIPVTITRAVLLAGVLLAAFAARLWLVRSFTPPEAPVKPMRIVSLAPSVTETLYALGLGPRIAGVTEYCAYPPEAQSKPRVAGFSSINYEALLRVRPDLVALPADKMESRMRLRQLGLPTLSVDTRTLGGFLDAVALLGASTSHEKEAEEILATIHRAMEQARQRAQGRTKPRVLFSVMHAYEGLGRITEINAVGDDGFYSELIALAGGENVYKGPLAFPRLSCEAVMHLDPEVVIDVVPPHADVPGVRRDWMSLSSVNAVRENRVFIFADEADTVPGPRLSQTLAKLSLAFHPPVMREGWGRGSGHAAR